MTILSIRTVGDPVLRSVCDPITVFDDDLARLIDDMLETMYDVGGVGLAGPQVGISKQIFTFGGIDDREGYIINPVLEVGEEDQEGGEGCLSVPGIYDTVTRAERVKVEALNAKGEKFTLEADGLLAICVQHELDHLMGIVFVEHLSQLKQGRIKTKLKKRQKHAI